MYTCNIEYVLVLSRLVSSPISNATKYIHVYSPLQKTDVCNKNILICLQERKYVQIFASVRGKDIFLFSRIVSFPILNN